MAVSGVRTFNPPIGNLAVSAFARCGVRRTEILAQHMNDAYNETNYMQASWSSDGITLWTVDQQTIPLVAGTATYSVPSDTVMITDLYIVIQNDNNRYITQFSRTDFSSLANPQSSGVPTVYWFDRTLSPTVTFWQVPDGNEVSAVYYRYRNMDDANIQQGGNAEVPYLVLDAYVAGLAHRLSRIYAPQLEDKRKIDAQEAYAIASKQMTENVPLYITPGLSGFYRA